MVHKHYFIFLVVFLFSLLGFFIFKSQFITQEQKKPLILCSTSMIADTPKILVGDKIEVISIMGPGIDPHLYKASSHDAYNIQKLHTVTIRLRSGQDEREMYFYVIKAEREFSPRLNREHSDFCWFKAKQLPSKFNSPTWIAIKKGLLEKAASH